MKRPEDMSERETKQKQNLFPAVTAVNNSTAIFIASFPFSAGGTKE
jgi:hypothetical protein